jgi:hypothetical protein
MPNLNFAEALQKQEGGLLRNDIVGLFFLLHTF